MAVLRSEIEQALDELKSNEGGMAFQGLAVVLGKQRWRDLIACERKHDHGLDAYAAPAGVVTMGLASSITPTLAKLSADAGTAKEHFPNLEVLIFVTTGKVGNPKKITWADAIRKAHDLELRIISREDIITSLMLPENAPLCASFLGISVEAEPTAAEALARIQGATREVLATWTTRLKGHTIVDLSSVRLDATTGTTSTDVLSFADMQDILNTSGRIVLEAPAGRGKTTTLIALAERCADAGRSGFLIDLPAWTTSGLGILAYVAGMPPFQARRIDAPTLARALETTPFTFLLNGWNEVATASSLQALQALRDLERTFPAAGIIIATRTHHVMPPLPGASRLRLLTLTREQRAAYLRGRLGAGSTALQRHLEADTVLDALTRTPFILSEVVSLFERGAPIPNTKIGVLEAVLRLLEDSPEHRNELRDTPLFGQAADYLGGLATRMASQAAVELPEPAARAIVREVGQDLVARGQLGVVPEPATVLATLTAHHVLERTDYPVVTFRFEHQQFQEYYAALSVHAHLVTIIDAADDTLRRFAATYANEPSWAEPLRMVAERCGAQTDDAQQRRQNIAAGRLLVELALAADAIFAAELARLGGDGVWHEVAGAVGTRLREWYAVRNDSHRRCALAGMLASGSSDFHDVVVPLLDGEPQQRLETYGLWPEFHLSLLGDTWQTRVRGWHEDARADFASAILHQRPVPEVVAFAAADPSMKVKAAAVSGMSWTGAEDEAVAILVGMDHETIRAAAQELEPDRVPVAVRPRIVAVLQEDVATAPDPWRRLRAVTWLMDLGQPDLEAPLKACLNELPVNEVRQHGFRLVRATLDRLRQRDPAWVSQWVSERIATGGLRPDPWLSLVVTVPEELTEQLLYRLEAEDLNQQPFDHIVTILARTATVPLAARVFVTLRTLRATIMANPDQPHEVTWAAERQLQALFEVFPSDIGIAGLLSSVADPPVPLEVRLATQLLSRVARSDLEPITGLDAGTKGAMRDYLKKSVASVLSEGDFDGELKADLASSLAQVGEPEDLADLVRLIDADVERMVTGRAAHQRGETGPHVDGANTTYAPWHVQAVVQLDPAGAPGILCDLLQQPLYTQWVAEAMARSVAPASTFERTSRYRQIWEARAGQRPVIAQPEHRARYATALAEHITRLLDAGQGVEGSRYLLPRLASALAAVDGERSAELVLRILSLRDRNGDGHCVDAAEALLASGGVLRTTETVAFVDALLERQHQYGVPTDTWLIKRCLALLPFVDDPVTGLNKLREVIAARHLAPYDYRDVVPPVGESRCDVALDVLRDLAADRTALTHFAGEWITAVARVDTPAARGWLLSAVDPDVEGLPAEVEVPRDVLAAHLADLARRSPDVERRLRHLAETNLPPLKRQRLGAVLKALGTPAALMAGLQLMDDRTTPSMLDDTFDQLETAFVERRPHARTGNVYTLAAAAANDVRRALFEMATSDVRRRKTAFALLGRIEEWRLEYGRLAAEPRHPAFHSGQPWPPREPPE